MSDVGMIWHILGMVFDIMSDVGIIRYIRMVFGIMSDVGIIRYIFSMVFGIMSDVGIIRYILWYDKLCTWYGV